MTKGQYYIKLLMKSFGMRISQRCLANATRELHMLKDAQELIGYYNHDNIDDIEELKTEYWQIQDLKKRLAEIEDEEKEIIDGLKDAIDKRGEINTKGNEAEKGLQEEVHELVDKRDELLEKRTLVYNEGKRVRKVYDGLKAEVEYLEKEDDGNSANLDKAKERLEECVSELGYLKGQRDIVAGEVAELDQEIREKEEKLDKAKMDSEFETFANHTDVGGRNKLLTALRSEKAHLVTEVDKNIRFVGSFLFSNRDNKEIRDCIKNKPQLLHQAKALRNSIILNHKLVDGRVAMTVDD